MNQVLLGWSKFKEFGCSLIKVVRDLLIMRVEEFREVGPARENRGECTTGYKVAY